MKPVPTVLAALSLTLTMSAWATPRAQAGEDLALDPSAVARGRSAIVEQGFLKPVWQTATYRTVRHQWGVDSPDPERDPEGYAAAFRQRYGFAAATVPNDGLPMGLKRGLKPDGTRDGIAIDCLTCHGGSIGGTSYPYLGNTQLDLKLFFDEMMAAEGRINPPATFVVNSARGTVNAGMFSVVLLSLRNTDLTFRRFPLLTGANLPEIDTPPWWLLRHKETMYYDGRTEATSVRTNMQFMLGEKTLEQFQALEPTFRDIRTYFLSLEAPKYPFAIDHDRAARGRTVYSQNCAKCHGITGGDHPEYPNRIVPLAEIGTDPARARGISAKFVAHYNATWFGAESAVDTAMQGYQAPPLDGIWATAPYLHNGSVPTLAALLDSRTRPARFYRPASTDFSHYDQTNVGWRFDLPPTDGPAPPTDADPKSPVGRRHSLFDSARFGLGNGGHTYGDALAPNDRRDLIEYLKTL